jgi:delta 1-pyrroline-5-carboxylate dehydrogenase
METLVADAAAKGAQVLAGGNRIGNRGYYYPLTVLAEVPDDARAMREEPFGPLALINPVSSLDEAIEKANALPYGLAAYAFTRSARNANRPADDLEAGNLSINHFVASIAETPFGGVKESGYGREGGTEGLACYTVAKNVSHLMISRFQLALSTAAAARLYLQIKAGRKRRHAMEYGSPWCAQGTGGRTDRGGADRGPLRVSGGRSGARGTVRP